jgi:biotin-(acetyl-CoA carboxylase) ligase
MPSTDAFPLDLPPGFTALTLRESGDAFAHAKAVAAEQGAGTLVWVRRYDLLEFAVVLEPDEPLASARRAHFASMTAMADSIAAHCPPERQVEFRWPDRILFDGGLLGGIRLGWPDHCAEDEVPEWLVTSIMLRTADLAHVDTGLVPGAVALMSEGFEMIETEALVGSYARHLMTHFDRWKERGFKPLAQDFFARLPQGKAGERRAIDTNGDMLVHLPLDKGAPERIAFLPALKAALWYDAENDAPKLQAMP